MPYAPIEYHRGCLAVLDQTRLPHETVRVELTTLEQVAEAITSLRVRGAPAIGVAAAFGVCVHVSRCVNRADAFAQGVHAVEILRRTRPTAVNLFWALDRMRTALDAMSRDNWLRDLEAEAWAVLNDGIAQERALVEHGLSLLQPGATVITHCNTGPLATGGPGTALGVLIAAHARLGGLHVYVNETRPRWQGAHLTTWELAQHGVPHTLMCDNMAAMLMRRGGVHSVWVGADRIAANGDSANKIGTYALAITARHHGVPLYVAAPTSTFDLTLQSGGVIPIEERDPAEVSAPEGHVIAPAGTTAWNPAFDVTPGELITAIVTEKGVFRGPVYRLREGVG
jgi:methylthioribose-1-phosphate isomerase